MSVCSLLPAFCLCFVVQLDEQYSSESSTYKHNGVGIWIFDDDTIPHVGARRSAFSFRYE